MVLKSGGTTDEDPPLHIIKEVTNSTTMTWIGYKIDLDPADPHTFQLAPPATSDMMTLVTNSPYSLEFGLPSPVGPGDTVTFDFVVDVVLEGGFSFTLTQSPIAVPEPATGALIFLATALGTALYRRRRS